jgi:hypothetical protein
MAIPFRAAILATVGVMALTGTAVARNDLPAGGPSFGKMRLPRRVEVEFVLIKGQSRLWRLPADAVNVQGGDEHICGWRKISQSRWTLFFLVGSSVGNTTIWGSGIDPLDPDRHVSFRAKVFVIPDLR